MKGGYQILDLKGVDLLNIDESNKIKLTKEQVKALRNNKVLLLNNVVYSNIKFNSLFVTNDSTYEYIYGLVGDVDEAPIVMQIGYDSTDEELNSVTIYYLTTYKLPYLPTTTENKTYVLKFVNGEIKWVEETE